MSQFRYQTPAQLAAGIAKHDAGDLNKTAKSLIGAYNPSNAGLYHVNYDPGLSVIRFQPKARYATPAFTFKYEAGKPARLVTVNPQAPHVKKSKEAALRDALASKSEVIVASDGSVVCVWWAGEAGAAADGEAKDEAAGLWVVSTARSIKCNTITRFRNTPEDTYGAALGRALASRGVELDSLDKRGCHVFCMRDSSINPCAQNSQLWHICSYDLSASLADFPRMLDAPAGIPPQERLEPGVLTYQRAEEITRVHEYGVFGYLVRSNVGLIIIESAHMQAIRETFYDDKAVMAIDRDTDRVTRLLITLFLTGEVERARAAYIAPHITLVLYPRIKEALNQITLALTKGGDDRDAEMKQLREYGYRANMADILDAPIINKALAYRNAAIGALDDAESVKKRVYEHLASEPGIAARIHAMVDSLLSELVDAAPV